MPSEVDGPSTIYRLFWIDRSGHVSGPPETIKAIGDEDAIERAKQLANARTVEIWCSSRHVATLNRDDGT